MIDVLQALGLSDDPVLIPEPDLTPTPSPARRGPIPPEQAEDSHEGHLTIPEPISHERPAPFLSDSTGVDHLLGLLPADRREEAAAILRRVPNARNVLEMCRLCVFDCWTAMERLGMQPFVEGLNSQTLTATSTFLTRERRNK